MTSTLAPSTPTASPALRRIERHMGTVVTLAATGIDDAAADDFFAAIERLESVLTRFRPGSDLSQIASGQLSLDDADPAVREVLVRCDQLRSLTAGDFEFEPKPANHATGVPTLDPNALAKGWIIDQAGLVLRLAGANDYFVNAGGDVVVARPQGARPWRVGIQHPQHDGAVLGTITLTSGAVATSGTYVRGEHIRMAGRDTTLTSVTVVGPELYMADALATAVFSSSQHEPRWWRDVDPSYGLLTLDHTNTLRWRPPNSAAGNGTGASFVGAGSMLATARTHPPAL